MKKKQIVVISGKQYSGKDTVANILKNVLENFRLAPLAEAIKIEFGEKKNLSLKEVEGNKPLYRPELIELGNKKRAKDSDYWINKVLLMDGNIIVPDIRLKHELDVFKKLGAVTIRVDAGREERAERGKLVKEDDTTETDLDNIKKWDYVIENNGSQAELEKKLQNIAEEIAENLMKAKI